MCSTGRRIERPRRAQSNEAMMGVHQELPGQRPATAVVTPPPVPVRAHPLRELQRTIGNQALGQLLTRDDSSAGNAVGRADGLDRFDPFATSLREQARAAAGNRPPPPPPEAVVPGDLAQQYEIFRVSGWAEADRPDVREGLARLAEQVAAHEALTSPGKVRHTKTAMLNYWGDRFAASVEYILTVRTNQRDPVAKASVSAQEFFRRELGREEARLAKSARPEELVAEVTALRERYRQKWAERVDLAVRRFVDLAGNEAQLMTADRRPQPAVVLGLPEGLEKEVTAAQAPEQLENDATPVSASVVTFMKAVQDESGLQAQAGNYTGHEKWSPHVSDASIGKFSFDVGPPVRVDPQTGFYDRAELIKFLQAVERAATKTGIEWMAFYNDATVVKDFNDSVGKGRIAFSGGGGGGTYHHGPQPYILHLHLNIMPINLRNKFLVGSTLRKAETAFRAFLAGVDALF
jgi:hypothetical protein